MRLSSLNRKDRSDDELIPLINVVFLLLIFFLLAGTLRPPESGGIRLPRIEQGAEADGEPPTLTLDREGQLHKDGNPLPDTARADEIDALGTAELVRIRADHRVDSHTLLVLVEQLRRAGTREIELLNERLAPEQPGTAARP